MSDRLTLGVSPKPRPLISLTPLIDVVFILLVFFMLVSNFVRWQSTELSVGQKVSQVSVDNNPNITIVELAGQGRYYIEGEQLDLPSIEALIHSRLIDGAHRVVLHVDEDLPLQQLLDIFVPLESMAGKRISLSRGAYGD